MKIAFWYEFASTYSYPAAMRIDEAAAEKDVDVAWCPFLLGPIFKAQGWADSPFNLYPAKGRYMWRDMERICARAGLPFKRPRTFPRNGLQAARIATLGLKSGWTPAFSRAVFAANFAQDRDIGLDGVLREILMDLSLDAGAILEEAQSLTAKEKLRARCEEAALLGVFGAPSFTVGDELFWGSDRLDEALDWASGIR